jgi:hypothetical protein
MLFVLLILISIVIAAILNKGFRGIENKAIKASYLIIIGFAIQIAIFNEKFATSHFSNLTPLLYIVSLIILLIFLVLNVNYKGFFITLIGFILNVSAIVANKGCMPQDIKKLELIGETKKIELLKQFGYFYNATVMSSKTHLNLLADRITFPFLKALGSVYSIGDLIIITGICIFIFEYMQIEK